MDILTTRDQQGEGDAAQFRPEPYLIIPRDELEKRVGKPTLLTDYHIDEIIDAMRKTSYDPDLMAKLRELRAAT